MSTSGRKVDSRLISKLIIIGAGKGGKSLIDFFLSDPTIKIIGVVDVNDNAPGMVSARQAGIPTSNNFKEFLKNPEPDLDIIIEVTGNDDVQKQVLDQKPAQTRMISGIAAKFIWALLEERSNHEYLKQKYDRIKEDTKDRQFDIIFGSSPLMKDVKQLIYQVAPTNSSVLITGETGTGKEMVAQAIVDLQGKENASFVKVNCTAFTDEIIESELFGHVKGSFTGAISNKKGILETADEGTLFLDEIGDVPLTTQVKLLRFLQFGEIRPVGSNDTRHVNTRIIAATNRNLKKLIMEDRFREDLFFRLNSFVIELPPLRNRKEDIPLYAYHFLKKSVLKLNKKVEKISTDALDYLIQYDWPGNLRELQGVIERAMILCESGEIEAKHLPISVQTGTHFNTTIDFNKLREEVLASFEKQALLNYLHVAEGNVTKAASLGKIPRRTFYRMLEKYKLKPEELKLDTKKN